MKKSLFTSLFILTALWGFSQITITNANIAPEGVTIIQANDTLPDSSIQPGNSGANQTWNFSAATADYLDTLYTELPSWTPYADSFPNANYVIRQTFSGDTSYVFADRNDDFFASLGYAGSMDDSSFVTLEVIPQEIIMDFPVEYGNQRTESFYYQETMVSTIPGTDSLRFKTATEKSVEVDAWGTITMPNGSYNCLRTITNRTDYDSVWIKMAGAWTLVSSDTTFSLSYDWYTNEILPGFDLFSLEYTDGVVSNVSFLYATQVGVSENKNTTAVIAPNPVKNHTIVQLSEKTTGTLKLYNQSGMCVVQKPVNGSTVALSLESLPAGIYVVVVTDASKTGKQFTGKLVKQ